MHGTGSDVRENRGDVGHHEKDGKTTRKKREAVTNSVITGPKGGRNLTLPLHKIGYGKTIT